MFKVIFRKDTIQQFLRIVETICRNVPRPLTLPLLCCTIIVSKLLNCYKSKSYHLACPMPIQHFSAVHPQLICKWHKSNSFILPRRHSSQWLQQWARRSNLRSRLRKIGIVLGGVLMCGSAVYLEVKMLDENLPSFNNVSNMDRRSESKFSQSFSRIAAILPWLMSQTNDHWNLLKLAQSESRLARIVGVKRLVQRSWEDYEYREIRQAADYRTFIGLARSENADMRFFRKPPQITDTKKELLTELRELLASLPVTEDPCVGYFTSAGLQKKETRDLGRLFWNLENADSVEDLNKDNAANSELSILESLLEAILRQSVIGNNTVEIVQKGGLALLRRSLLSYPGNVHLQQLCARILGNLALLPETHERIVQSGWVSILVKWLKSVDIDVCLNTARALANMDIDSASAMYHDGIYVLHPIYRSKEPIYADVVFVHGLLGGPFKTWRQGGSDQKDIAELEESISQGLYTRCWPKSWLPQDCPHIRVLTVEYDTYLSELSAICPFDREKRSLFVRAKLILQKLRKAGIGERPIIWIGHSMGGLLIKQMLLLDELMERKVVKNSKGIVFYSVPHRGSTLATLWKQAWFLLYPSIEVKELDPDSLFLRTLHKNFQELIVSSEIKCVSFGELQKTPLGMRFQALIVPPHSSDPGFGMYYGIEANHVTICKPIDPQSLLYAVTLKCVQHWANQKLVDSVMEAGLSIEDQLVGIF
ncbi:protein SERAC1 isoform X3 [Octopus sinensis]|uniref:Protein SERAC1 n=1 Tax=Octopus sinensis TaxID=2607531 RepID=A0A7E6EIR2_9MOLL|nr:protein SERAC1 isoform X3 [Octopus sinensis]